jgi:hypothetical protein
VEHHFLEEYSYSSAPEVFLAACSHTPWHRTDAAWIQSSSPGCRTHSGT